MEKMLTEICDYLNNYFDRKRTEGKFRIVNGKIDVSFLQEGQYFRVIGSIFNDGVHKYSANVNNMTDEEFEGAIWSMAVPKTVIDLASEISSWVEAYGSATSQAMSPFSSESFGNYSYSKSAGSSSASSSTPNSWQSAYAARLAPFRKLRGII